MTDDPPDRLAGYFGSRPADRLSRRLTTKVLVTLEGPDTASATSYSTTYRVDGTWLPAHRTTALAVGGDTPRSGP